MGPLQVTRRPLSVAMIDIDHFKRSTTAAAMTAGDAMLRQVAGILRDQTRGTDAVCRVGGEEFLIIFPSQTIQEAGICAERCRKAVAAHAFTVGQTRSLGDGQYRARHAQHAQYDPAGPPAQGGGPGRVRGQTRRPPRGMRCRGARRCWDR